MKSRPKLIKNFVFDESTKETKAYMKIINPVMFEVRACCSENTLDSIVGLLSGGTKDFVGTAKPDEEDEFSEYIGKDVSGMKADLKYHMYMAKQYLKLRDVLSKAYDELTELAQFHYEKSNHIVNDISNRYYKEEGTKDEGH